MSRHDIFSQPILFSGRNQNGQKGFTLMEMLIAIFLAVVGGSVLFSVTSSNMKLSRTQKSAVDMNQNIRSALFIMKRELQSAGYDPLSMSIGESSKAGITSQTVGVTYSDSITFTFVADSDGMDNDNNNSIDEVGELATITFALYDEDGSGEATTLGRIDGLGSTPRIPIAENVERLQFSYGKALSDERTLVRITMLVRANKPDDSFYNSSETIYEVPDSSGIKWTVPAGDRYRRKLVSTVMKCKNAAFVE